MNSWCLGLNPLNLLAILIATAALSATVVLACATVCFGVGKDK